jgi:hypothetical protein
MNFLLYVFGVIGITHIIVDPATIMQPFRDWADQNMPKWFNKLVGCYQCCGFWIGAIFAVLLFCNSWLLLPVIFFLGGGSGSVLSTGAAAVLNWLEANSIIDLGEGDKKLDEISEKLNEILNKMDVDGN